MKLALISDIHGNEVALRAVLQDIRREGVDQIVCLGDTATLGPRPREVLALLREHHCPGILGNHDEFMLEAELIHTYTEAEVIVDAIDWCRALLTADDLEFLRRFERTRPFDLGYGNTLFAYHGSPLSHMDNLLATTPVEELDRYLDGHTATVLTGGHTHLQMMRQHHGMLVVNPGSVGMPFKDFVGGMAPTVMPYAEYAIVESEPGGVDVRLRRVNVDLEAMRAALRDSTVPVREFLLCQYAT